MRTMTRLTIALTLAWVLAALTVFAHTSETCFYKGEKTDGMNKICYYSCVSGEAAITISSVKLCPLSIKR